jgi:hypothetical protein
MMTYEKDNGTVAMTTTSGTVSKLARDARKVLGGRVDRMEAIEVLRRIDALAAEWRSVPTAPIHAWLRSLRTQVERA